jgi:hypothetical protein
MGIEWPCVARPRFDGQGAIATWHHAFGGGLLSPGNNFISNGTEASDRAQYDFYEKSGYRSLLPVVQRRSLVTDLAPRAAEPFATET